MTSIRSLAIIAAMVAATFGALALMPAERGSPEGEAAAKPVAPEPPKHVSALDLDEPRCHEFTSLTVQTSSHDVGIAPAAFKKADIAGCAVEMIATGKAADAASLSKPPTTCSITATRSTQAGIESQGKVGLALEVEAEGKCADTHLKMSVQLNAPTDERGVPTRGATAFFNPWDYRIARTKITGQDVINIDMVWVWNRLYWWFDGYAVSDGSATTGYGDDAFWFLSGSGTSSFWKTSGVPNHYGVWREAEWFSYGFPNDNFPNIGSNAKAYTVGFYNGSVLCDYEHDYTWEAIFYPDLHLVG